jgi:nucleoside-diphosphate-sugar epimerase
MKILVTGGLGFIGFRLVQNLIDQGHEVHALGRTQKPTKAKETHGLHYHPHDLSTSVLSADWFLGTDTIFHVAAKAGMGGNFTEYLQANLVSTEKLLVAAKQAKVKRFIYTSTPSVVFSKHPICNGTESLPYSTENFSPYATTKAWAEKAVLLADNKSGMRTIALRPHLVWGAGDPHLLPRVIARHQDNVVHAHLCALESMQVNASLGGKAYFIGQNEPVFLWEWLNHIFTELDLPTLEKAVPFKTAYHLGFMIEKLWGALRIKSDPPMTRFVACQLAQDHWFSSEAAQKDLGYQPILSMDQALEKTLPWLRSL